MAKAGDLSAEARSIASLRWGILDGPWLWQPRLRILFVLDGRISTTDDAMSFGLGLVLDTLTDDSYAWWVRYQVDVVRRDDGTRRNHPPLDRYPERLNFSFTEDGFHLDAYDQVWFFGDYPMNQPGDPGERRYHPLTDPELKVLAEWMDRGGGVFATGDHYNLGASMCSRIPRVRTMRKWTVAQGVPTEFGNNRNETLQHEPDGYEDIWEGDAFPQPIEPVYRRVQTSALIRPTWPHTLLSLPWGYIDKFPDHMHEGQVFDDNEVELDRPLDIEGYDGVEYPELRPVVAAALGGAAAPGAWPGRPRPHVVAYGHTTHRIIPEVAFMAASAPNVTPALTSARRIGLVGAYDGSPVGIGRVVVDSTWHHWFSYNLHGFRDADPATYQGMQAYYRNVGLWLTTPAQRRSILVAAAWGAVAADPMAFPATGRPFWSVGERVVAVMSRTASQPAIADLVTAFFPNVDELSTVADEVHPAEPSSTALPWDVTARAIVGGIATALLRPAADYHAVGGQGRRLLDPAAVVRYAAEGARHGYLALTETLLASAASATELAGRLEEGFPSDGLESIPIDVELANLRIGAERVQLTDFGDTAVDGHLTFTVRLTIAGTVVANRVVEDVRASELQKSLGVVDLDFALFEGIIQSGERVLIQVLSGAVEPHDPALTRVRYAETLVAAPTAWIGAHAPRPTEVWRLWYRVERAENG